MFPLYCIHREIALSTNIEVKSENNCNRKCRLAEKQQYTLLNHAHVLLNCSYSVSLKVRSV